MSDSRSTLRGMQTLREIYAELKAIFGNKWSVLGLILTAIIARFDWLAKQFTGYGMTNLTGLPDWAVGLCILALWTAGAALWHAVKLRRTVTPGFRLSFDPNGFGVG